MPPTSYPKTRLVDRFLKVVRSSKIALQDSLGDVEFATLGALAQSLSNEIGELQGNEVALLASKERSWVAGFWAVLLSGGAVVPLSPMYPTAERLALLRQAGAKLMLTSPDISLTQAELQALEEMGVMVKQISPVGVRRNAAVPAQCGLPAFAESVMGAMQDEHSAAMMLFTSGTTGRPKRVPLSHHNLYEGLRSLSEAWSWRDDDCLLHVLPLHHLHGICVALLLSFLSGTSTILEARFEPKRVVEFAGKATVLMGVPSSHKLLLDEYESQAQEVKSVWREKLHRYRLITSGSSKLPVTVGQAMEIAAGQYPLERYGMTEIGIVVSNPVSGPRRRGSAGRAMPGVELKIVDENGEPVAEGQSGELWVRASSVFSGYADDDAATRAAFSAGFFRTGDTARWLTNGYIELLGRMSVDILKTGGYKISALEIEEALRAHAQVSEVAVVGLPDETWGQKVAAAIVLRESASLDTGSNEMGQSKIGTELTGQTGAAPTQASVQEWLAQRIVAYKVPRCVKFVRELPRNAMGKVVKPRVVSEIFA